MCISSIGDDSFYCTLLGVSHPHEMGAECATEITRWGIHFLGSPSLVAKSKI